MEMFDQKYIPQNSMRDFIAVLFKHKNKVAVVFLTIIITVTIGTLLAPKVYETEAKLFVRLGNETVHTSTAGGERIQISQSMDNQLNSEIEILRSRQLAENVLNDMGLQAFQGGSTADGESQESLFATVRKKIKAMLSFPKQAVARFLSDPSESTDAERLETEEIIGGILENLDASVVTDSNIITLTYAADDPQLAHDVLNKLISIYMERHIELHGSPGSLEFFQKESNELREQLEAAEMEFKEMKNEIGVGDLNEQRTILSEQLGSLQREKEDTHSGIASSQARIDSLQARLNNLPEQIVVSETTGFAQSAMEEMHRRIYELKLQEQELLSTFTEKSIPVAEIRRQIKEAEELLGKAKGSRQVTTGMNQTYQDLNVSLMLEKGTLEALKAKKNALEIQIDSALEKLRNLNEAEVHLSKLQRKKNQLEENYKKYADSLEQMRIDQERERDKISNISIAQAPVVPLDPARPKTGLNLLLGLFLAVFGGLGLAFFMEYLDDSFQKPEQVEAVLELPVLGSIKKLDEK